MSEEQPEALRLADGLADRRDWYEFDPSAWCPQAAAELRRLHEANQELLTAAKLALEYWVHRQKRYKNRSPVWVQETRAAIAKAEGQQ